MRLHLVTVSLIITALTASAQAETTLHALFTDHAVLQRDVTLPVFGYADDGQAISVELAGVTRTTTAADGRWRVEFPAMSAGGPHTLSVSGEATIILENILIGDVWICTGQSNMFSPLGRYAKNAPEIIGIHAQPAANDQIRLLSIATDDSDTPLHEPQLSRGFPGWLSLDAESGPMFSANGYFFGIHLQPHVNVPIGLIQSSVGGTPAEAWTPREALEKPANKHILTERAAAVAAYPEAQQQYEQELAAWLAKNMPPGTKASEVPRNKRRGMPRAPSGGPEDHDRPSCLYNAMIAPLQDFPIKGAIWNQGESNTSSYARCRHYEVLLSDMVAAWREGWGSEFPFYLVQLAPYRKISEEPTDPRWAWMRETMRLLPNTLPNSAMACIIDGGCQSDIHPPYKEIAGERLALLARKHTYGQDIVAGGPQYQDIQISGDTATITFTRTGSGLTTQTVVQDLGEVVVDAATLAGFTICGSDGVFHNATATITGTTTVTVTSAAVSQPVAVRYAWAEFPRCNLYNKEGLPASPFRTDDFPPPAD